MLLLFTQRLTVAFRIYLALDYIVDNGDTGDNANVQQLMHKVYMYGNASHELLSISLRSGFLSKRCCKEKSVLSHMETGRRGGKVNKPGTEVLLTYPASQV